MDHLAHVFIIIIIIIIIIKLPLKSELPTKDWHILKSYNFLLFDLIFYICQVLKIMLEKRISYSVK